MMSRKRLKSNRFLPEHVSAFKSQHGRVRYRFRRKGYPGGYFAAQLGTEEFRAEYHAFMNPGEVAAPPPPQRYKPGTIDDLVQRYFEVPTRLGPSKVTQDKIRAVLEDFREGTGKSGGRRGDRLARDVTFEAIDKIIAKKMIKTGTGNKTKGGLHAARKLRKELVRLFDFAIKSGLMDKNPAALSDKVKQTASEKAKAGFHSWTEDEITQFRSFYELGTRERLAMELLLWTDQRRSDVISMGEAQIVDGCIPVHQEKTGMPLWLPVAPQLRTAIDSMKAAETSKFCFLITRRGGSFTKESFGNFFKKACVAAGLPQCTAHGLRKATLRRMAELEMANKTMKSLSGQTSDKTLEIYTRDANQRKLANKAIHALSQWEASQSEDDRDRLAKAS
ncbi:MAG: tyrosine-type recombinase/integrase [Novosphingobium sp.]|uniref:tyrosine-type recombinase/integrase n=1 Tax=Novosphingobium sp. TaxID=1874826 RepID=UPI003B9A5558